MFVLSFPFSNSNILTKKHIGLNRESPSSPGSLKGKTKVTSFDFILRYNYSLISLTFSVFRIEERWDLLVEEHFFP